MIERAISATWTGSSVGFTLWVFRNRLLVAAAFGSIPLSGFKGLVERFGPDWLVREDDRTRKQPQVKLPEGGWDYDIWYARPRWRLRTAWVPDEAKSSWVVNNAWRIGWDTLMRHGKFLAPQVPAVPYDRAWLEEWGGGVRPGWTRL